MSAIANRYTRGELVGVGFECDFGGARVHSIAWENAQVERLRDDPIFTEGLIIDRIELAKLSDLVNFKVDAAVVPEWHVDPPEVIATHETIEPAITETPVEPIQEPVVSVSELTASPPSLALDTPVEVAPEVVEEVVIEDVAEPWKPTPGDSEAQTIRSYFKQFGIATPHSNVIAALSAFGIEVTSAQVLMAKKAIKQ